jgi:hypothetical protein
VNALRVLGIAAVFAAAGCGPSGGGEDVSAPLGTGIPVAPPGAMGVRFDEMAGLGPVATRKPSTKGAPTQLPPMPPDPFGPLESEPPPGQKPPGSAPKPENKKPEIKQPETKKEIPL